MIEIKFQEKSLLLEEFFISKGTPKSDELVQMFSNIIKNITNGEMNGFDETAEDDAIATEHFKLVHKEVEDGDIFNLYMYCKYCI